jgi:hypothetical protein
MADVYLGAIEPFVSIVLACIYWKAGFVVWRREGRKIDELAIKPGGGHNGQLLVTSEI